MTEAEAIFVICSFLLNGTPEVRHDFRIDGGSHFIRVDCETETHVIEVGLDKRSSLDSVQQALFASEPSGKEPAVILVDTDGVEGPFEYRIEAGARSSGVAFSTLPLGLLVRLQMTEFFRLRRDQLSGPRTLSPGG